jgi:OOP family OmpA-OmpF porin
MMLRTFGIAIFCAVALPRLGFAAPPAEGDPLAAGDPLAETAIPDARDTPERSRDRRELRWIERWAPERTMVELGIYGGVLLPAPDHEWFEPDLDLPAQGFKQLNMVSPDVGLRLGFYPSRFVGLEAEGGVLPSTLRDASYSKLLSDPALLYTARGHLVLQIGLRSVTPFVLVGGGALGVASPRELLGNDIDPAVHFGGGLKFYLSRRVMLRVDVRDVVSYERGPENVWASHSPEFLLGLSGTFGRNKDKPLPKLPEPKVAPPGPVDSDGDGMLDDADTCPLAAETVNGHEDADGCPETDTDSDGFWDDQDICPNQAETVNDYKDQDGCPEADPDGDRFLDEQDICPSEAETPNGYKDEDGCPDEVPAEVQEFTGAIRGITFDVNQATIRRGSHETLDRAVQVLKDNPDIRIAITGHTDDVGTREHNVDLSMRSAEAVKLYLVEHGIDEDRITTEGLGPDKPVDTNETKVGRANNRRIEFEIITS